MSVTVTINGTPYSQPDQGTPVPWGDTQATIIAALASSTLQKNGGTFTLTADANFGATYGLVSQYFKSPTANVSASGILRLANLDAIKWRNGANAADISLYANSVDELLWDAGIGSTVLVQSNAGDAVLGLRVNQAAGNTWYFRNANSSSDTLKFDYSVNTVASLTTLGELSLGTGTLSSSGHLRLARDTSIGWRNVANSADLLLSVNGSNQLTFDGVALAVGSGDVAGPGGATDNAVARFDLATGKIIQNSVVIVGDTGDITGASNITATGALLSGLTASRAVVTDGSKNLTSSAVTATELGYVSGVTSAIQTQLGTKTDGAASSTDNAIARFDSTTGKIIQNSVVTIDDTGVMAGSGKAVFANSVATERTRTTGTSVGAGGIAISNGSGLQSRTSATFADITNLSVTLTTSGRPVRVAIEPIGTSSGTQSTVNVTDTGSGATGIIKFLRDASDIAYIPFGNDAGTTNQAIIVPAGAFCTTDAVAAGTYTYKAQFASGDGVSSVNINNIKLIAYEL